MRILSSVLLAVGLIAAGLALRWRRRGRSTESHATRFFLELGRLPIAIDREQDSDLVLALARTHGLTAYDAAYLETALRHGVPLATLDQRLAAAARQQGAPTFTLQGS